MDTYLVHHGIKGQKWGVRRYQNEDGSLTELGRSRDRSNVSGDASSTVYRRGDGLNNSSSNRSGDSRAVFYRPDSYGIRLRNKQYTIDSNPKSFTFSSGRESGSTHGGTSGYIRGGGSSRSTPDEDPDYSEWIRKEAKRQYKEYMDQYNKEVTPYVMPQNEPEELTKEEMERLDRIATPDLDGKANKDKIEIKQYSDRSKDHTSKSYVDRHSIDTRINSYFATQQQKNIGEHMNAAIQRGIREVSSIINHLLSSRNTKSNKSKTK